MLRTIGVICIAVLLLMGCQSDNSSEGSNPKLRQFQIVADEYEVEYVPGSKTKVWAYNQQIPGPTLQANVGDVVEVRFINRLPEPSTLHWHGLELPANQDGSHISQKPVPPGGEFTYRFKVLRAATYWYHSHVKPNEQVEKGLHGAFVVNDPKENAELQLPDREITLMLDDVLLDADAQLAPPLPEDPIEKAITLTNGRIGNHILVHGKRQPSIQVKNGEPLRLRFINAANSRFFRLSFGDAKAYRIGGDTGLLAIPKLINPVGLISNPDTPEEFISDPDRDMGLLLTPGERAEVLIVPQGSQNQTLVVENHDLPRGQHFAKYERGTLQLGADGSDGKKPPVALFNFRIRGEAGKAFTFSANQKLRASKNLVVPEGARKKPLHIMFGHGPSDLNGNIMFFARAKMMANGMMHPMPMMKLTNETTLNANVGETRIIEVVNMSRGIHPFHMHGFPFQWLETVYMDSEHPERNRVVKNTDEFREYKDTYPVPGRPGFRMKSKTISRFVVHLGNEHLPASQMVAYGGKSEGTRSGGWMVHCHILEHARYGMAAWLNLWPTDVKPKVDSGHDHHDHGHH